MEINDIKKITIVRAEDMARLLPYITINENNP
jgi:hypothetical protein